MVFFKSSAYYKMKRPSSTNCRTRPRICSSSLPTTRLKRISNRRSSCLRPFFSENNHQHYYLGKFCLQTLFFHRICCSTLLFCVFAKYHYKNGLLCSKTLQCYFIHFLDMKRDKVGKCHFCPLLQANFFPRGQGQDY